MNADSALSLLPKPQTIWVIKIGSSLITDNGRGLKPSMINGWVDQIAALRTQGVGVVLVSSGSVAEGVQRLGLGQRPEVLYDLQAVAAVGQMGMIQAYAFSFQRYATHTAQILLTHDDVSDRQRYLNTRSTLRRLLQFDVVPIVNENDTIATRGNQLGDNDQLAGLVANLVEADMLVMLTDQQGLFDGDPRSAAKVSLIKQGRADDPTLQAVAGSGGVLGRGGMHTKLKAASLAARSGTAVRIVNGRTVSILKRLYRGEDHGTLLTAGQAPITARKQWLAGQLMLKGLLHIDAGAERVLRYSGRSLLAVGVCDAEGDFGRGDVVACITPKGHEIARGLVNYAAAEVRTIKGHHSEQIKSLLGYIADPELIHRDNLVITATQ